VSISVKLPRFVVAKPLVGGRTGFYWTIPGHWRRKGCPLESTMLGVDLGEEALERLADDLNARLDGWRQESIAGLAPTSPTMPGTVAWLFREYLKSDAFEKRVAPRSRPDYRNLFEKIIAMPPVKGPYRRVGDLPILSISPRAADKLYARLCEGGRYRRGEKAVTYCKTAWRIMQRLYPVHFPTDVPNPWLDLTVTRRQRAEKPAVDREMVYRFAWAVADHRPELAAAAVICFEWLQRPENVIGHMTWNDYRGPVAPEQIRIVHHKTGETVLHPLADENGEAFYEEAEQVLARLPRRGLLMVLGPDGQRYQPTRFAQLVRREADRLELPSTFTLDACRHGGMTELEEAELTEGQGMALSAHRTPRAYRGYAKRTEKRILAATRRRIAHRRANG
jgi:integrase